MRTAIAAAALALALNAPASARDYTPRDECGEVDGAVNFRTALSAAVASRDAAMLQPLFAEDAILDFGGGSGRDLLRERLDDPDYGLWEALEALEPLGCTVTTEGRMVMPWLWAQDLGENDPYGILYITGADVPVYRGADGDDVLTRVSWALAVWSAYLEQTEEDQSTPRAKIVLEDGATGYIARNRLRSLLDYRLLAERVGGRWQITAFVAGD